MSYTYKNITKTTQLLTLPSAQRNTISHIHLAPNSSIDLSYPGLDMYMPHILARMDGGINITHTVLRQNDNAKSVASPEAATTPAATTPTVSKPAVTETRIAGNPTAVRPGVYLEKVPAASAAPVIVPAVVAAPATTPEVATTTATSKAALLAELKDIETKLTEN